ncbi:hypothetical protein BDF14DRAFT_1852760 [Spinellus fusiger]|nr:hypothetical protein BDF14DRAFT_1852760 [Spinellus fusiger]
MFLVHTVPDHELSSDWRRKRGVKKRDETREAQTLGRNLYTPTRTHRYTQIHNT